MAITLYGDISPRTAVHAQRRLLERAIPYMVLEKFGQARPVPERSSKVTKFRRYEALDPTPTALTEGVTPVSGTIQSTDVTATLVQYGSTFSVSDVIMDTHEDDVLMELQDLVGEQAAQMMETMRWNILKAGTNVQYANNVAGRSSVVAKISLTDQRRVTRGLKRQNARKITKTVRSTVNYGTENVAAGYVALCHPDLETDIRDMTGFTPVEKYGTLTPWENEIGKVEDVRYLSSTIFEPLSGAANAGGAVGSMLPNDTDPTKAAVYPVLYLAADAYGIVALKGQNSITPIVVMAKPSDSDRLAQRNHVGFKTMQTACILNDLWMCRLEVAVTA